MRPYFVLSAVLLTACSAQSEVTTGKDNGPDSNTVAYEAAADALEAQANNREAAKIRIAVAEPEPEPVADATSAVPSFDTNGYCAQVASVGGGSYSIEASCREMESEARNQLSSRSIPDRVLNYCEKVARVSGDGSYSIMNSCVDMELSAAAGL